MKKGEYYINKKEFLEEYKLCIEKDELTEKFISMCRLLIERIARCNRYPSEEDAQDCKSHAMYTILKSWRNFDVEKGSDPFSYFSSFVWTGLAQGWNLLHPKVYTDDEIKQHNEEKAERKAERRRVREEARTSTKGGLF